MALELKDRVKVTTTTTGTGALAIGSAQFGYRSFSVLSNGATTYYTLVDNATGDWEVGLGTYSASGPTLDRTTVLSSSTGTTINLQAGPKDLFIAYPAGRAVTTDGLLFSSILATPTTLSGYGITDAYGTTNGQLAGNRNKLINGSGAVNQRAVTSVADDVYFSDRWYALHESGNVTVAHIADPEVGAISGFRLTQPDITAKRIGLAQIIERNNIRQCASAAMNLFARVKCSSSTAIRFAVLEHTGTADVVTSDVVNNWASSTFTAGNFFIAGLNVIKTGTLTPGAATWGSINDWSALGANVNNVIVFFWTESALAQNGTFEVNRSQYEQGVVATPFEWRINELQFCQRYYYKIATGSGFGTDFTAGLGICTSTTNIIRAVCGAHPVEMRAAPTITNWANLRAYSAAFAAITSLSHDGTTNQRLALTSTSSGGGLTANAPGAILSNSATAAVIELSSEL